MAGFVLDIFAAFLVRWIVIYWREAISHGWWNLSGSVVRCHLERPGYGCMYVVLQYKYKWNFERYRGTIKKPYVHENYAEAFMRRHPAGCEIGIRVDPKDPHRSCPVIF